jgi:hypothetical protein
MLGSFFFGRCHYLKKRGLKKYLRKQIVYNMLNTQKPSIALASYAILMGF